MNTINSQIMNYVLQNYSQLIDLMDGVSGPSQVSMVADNEFHGAFLNKDQIYDLNSSNIAFTPMRNVTKAIDDSNRYLLAKSLADSVKLSINKKPLQTKEAFITNYPAYSSNWWPFLILLLFVIVAVGFTLYWLGRKSRHAGFVRESVRGAYRKGGLSEALATVGNNLSNYPRNLKTYYPGRRTNYVDEPIYENLM